MQLLAPIRAGREPVKIAAALTLSTGATSADPETLTIVVDGGTLETASGAPLAFLPRVDAGYFEAFATFPADEHTYELYAAFPDAGLAARALTIVDSTAPRVEVRLSPHETRARDDSGFSSFDPQAPDAYRRDETVIVTVDAPEPDFIVGSLELRGDSGVLQRFDLDAGCVSRFDGGSCRQQWIDLWRHPMNAYSATASLSLRVGDDLGNFASIDGGAIQITRFKWERRFRGFVDSFALTTKGNLLVHHTSSIPYGTVALSPSGAIRWNYEGNGNRGHLMVGGHATNPVLYLAEQSGTGIDVSVLNATNPQLGPITGVAPTFIGATTGAPVLVTRDREYAYFPLVHAEGVSTFCFGGDAGSRTSTFRDAGIPPFATVMNPTASGDTISLPVLPDNSVVGGALFTVQGFAFAEVVSRTSQPNASVVTAVPISATRQFFSVSDGGRPSSVVTSTGSIPIPLAAANIVVGSTHAFLNEARGLEPVIPTLCSLPLAGGQPTCIDAKTTGVPILGCRSGTSRTLYAASVKNVTMSTDYRVVALNEASLEPEWETPQRLDEISSAPLSLDCSRDSSGNGQAGQPGVLYTRSYVSAQDVDVLRAVVVDSPGLDDQAAWPMEKHDPRNTNYLATPLADFSCP
ncbi:MAG: hypothetical protein JNK82_44905 [Myxococcaceae bacterium]|nr:hypothetical protein [Myxococcaceae bacterium]